MLGLGLRLGLGPTGLGLSGLDYITAYILYSVHQVIRECHDNGYCGNPAVITAAMKRIGQKHQSYHVVIPRGWGH